MPKRERHKTKIPGVSYVEEEYSAVVAIGLEPDKDTYLQRLEHEQLEEDERQFPVVFKNIKTIQRVYYIRFRTNGKLKEERIGGTAWECITPSQAASILKLRRYQDAGDFTGVDVAETKKRTEAKILYRKFENTINETWIKHRLFHDNDAEFKQERKLFNKYVKPLICPVLIDEYASGTGIYRPIYQARIRDLENNKTLTVTDQDALYPNDQYFGWSLTSPWYVADVLHELDLSVNQRRKLFLLLAKLARDYLKFDYRQYSPPSPPVEENRPGREELAMLMDLMGYEHPAPRPF
ncbi:MAG: hypothetical protein IBX64_14045 [Actinobacteria bacterium]|nr:hypothetical protein [Actinomycetota bacterium]